METFAALPVDTVVSPLTVELTGQKLPTPANVHAVPVAPGIVRLKLGLSRSLPPGSYAGSIQVGSIRLPFVAEVQGEAHLAVSPPSLSLEVAPDGEVSTEISVVNTGNAPCEVGRVYAFGLFRVDGLEDALGATYRSEKDDQRPWIDRLGTHLTDAHGGLARVQVKEGAGPLAPGEMRTLRLALHFPAKLAPGRAYTGNLPLHNLRYFIKVQVPNQKAPRNRT
jgi:hypothetical protein